MGKKTTHSTISFTVGTVEMPVNDGSQSRPAPLPSKATLAFIRQFARVYSYESSLGSSLGGLMAN